MIVRVASSAPLTRDTEFASFHGALAMLKQRCPRRCDADVLAGCLRLGREGGEPTSIHGVGFLTSTSVRRAHSR